MSLITSFRRMFSGSGPLSNKDTGYQLGATEKTTTASGTTVTDERALKISAVWACVQLISNSVAGLPLDAYRDTPSGRENLKSRHYLTDILQKQPNRYMKPRDFRMAMTVQMAMWSNAYAEKVFSGERLVALIPLRPGRMLPFIGLDGELTYHYSTDRGVKVYSQKEIFHLKGFGTDGIIGAERNNYSREAMGLAASAETFAAKQFANGGRPGGVLTFSEFLTEEQRAQSKKLYEGMAAGATNGNRLWVLEGGADYKGLDFSADQMQMIATRSQQLSEIARFFGVPGVMIGAGENGSSAWPASFEQQMLSFLTFTLQSYLDEWEAAIKFSLLPPGSDIGVDHDVAPLVKMDSTSRANYWGKMTQNGIATRNEARISMNMPESDDPGADKLTVQTNLTNIEDLGSINDATEKRQPAQ